MNPDEKVHPVDITNALPETVVTNKDLVGHIKNLVAEKTQLSTADNKAIMSILPKDVKPVSYTHLDVYKRQALRFARRKIKH